MRLEASEQAESEEQQNNTEISELVTALQEIENNYLEQGYTKENNPSNTQQSPRG